MKWMIVIITLTCIISCNSNNINDSDKRNAHWAWWVDAKTNKGQWIPVTDSTFVENGTYTLFYFNGNVYEKDKLRGGKNVDTTFEYDYQGKLYAYHFWGNDSTYYLNDGSVKNFRADGSIFSEGIVTNHKAGDKWIDYYDNGNKNWAHDYTKGDTGWQVSYFENGQVKDSSIHLNNLSWGDKIYSVKECYENGEVAEIRNWKNKLLNGIRISYYPNGQIKDSSFFVNGKQVGTEKLWYENGVVETVLVVNHSNSNGTVKSYYPSGKIKIIAFTKNNELVDGTTFDEDGKIIRTMKNGVVQQ